jgi:hypothetical protein
MSLAALRAAMNGPRLGAIALAVATVAFAGAGTFLKAGGYDCPTELDCSGWGPVTSTFELVSVLATAVVGLSVALRRPGNPIGWIFGCLAFVTALYLAAGGYATRSVALAPQSLPGGEWAAWFRNWIDRSSTALVLLAFLLFPTGRLASPRWRPALVLPPLVALGFAARAFVPGPMDFLPALSNPLGLEWVPRSVDDGGLGGLPLLVGSVVALAELVTRFRAAGASEREQIKWLALPLVVLVIALIATIVTQGLGAQHGIGGILVASFYLTAQILLPICMGIAVLRYRLYDIDLLINRALVYGATTAGIAVAFFAGIVLLQMVLRPLTNGSEFAVAASTLASFALFQPLRRRMQQAVDRRFDRSRYDAARTLDAFADRLRDEVDLDALRADLLGAVRQTMGPAHASLWLRERVG